MSEGGDYASPRNMDAHFPYTRAPPLIDCVLDG